MTPLWVLSLMLCCRQLIHFNLRQVSSADLLPNRGGENTVRFGYREVRLLRHCSCINVWFIRARQHDPTSRYAMIITPPDRRLMRFWCAGDSGGSVTEHRCRCWVFYRPPAWLACRQSPRSSTRRGRPACPRPARDDSRWPVIGRR